MYISFYAKIIKNINGKIIKINNLVLLQSDFFSVVAIFNAF